MNREIKFRAWCEGKHDDLTFNQPHMDYDVTLSKSGNWLDVESGFDIHGEYPSIPIMQYTGLKDKNGVEIYEGDILKWNDLEWGNPYTELVEWDYGLLDMRENDWSNWCEVVGNIHESAELLQK